MNILLAYPKIRGTTAEYIERSLKREHYLEVFDLLNTPNWTIKMGKAIPRGWGKNVLGVIKEYGEKPDVIIEIDGEGSRHLKGLRKCKIPSLYWAIDSHRSKLAFQLKIAKDFDYLFVAQKDYLPLFRKVNLQSFWLPLASDAKIHKDYQMERKFDIVFVGSVNPKIHVDRVRLIKRLSEKFDMKIFENVWLEEMAKIFSQAKIVFNKSVSGDLNMRIFEVMSCGAMLLTDDIENGIKDLFVDRKHLVLYKEHNLEELVEYYLGHDDEREKIAKEGQKAVHEKHTYDVRVDTMLLPFSSS